jgi:anti-sigma B factor antagonist
MKIHNPNPQTLEVTGLVELVAANAGQVRDAIRAELKPSHTTLNIDLSTVTFLDSSGLGALISLHKSLRTQNGAVRLIRPAPNVSQILELTRLHRVFEIVNA